MRREMEAAGCLETWSGEVSSRLDSLLRIRVVSHSFISLQGRQLTLTLQASISLQFCPAVTVRGLVDWEPVKSMLGDGH